MLPGEKPSQTRLITSRIFTIESADTVTYTNRARPHLSNFKQEVDLCLQKRVKSKAPVVEWREVLPGAVRAILRSTAQDLSHRHDVVHKAPKNRLRQVNLC